MVDNAQKQLCFICLECGLWQLDNLFHQCSQCGGEIIHRFDEDGKPVDLTIRGARAH